MSDNLVLIRMGVVMLIVTLCLIFPGCRKVLCEPDHNHGTKLYLEIDWSVAHAKPTTVDVYFFERQTPPVGIAPLPPEQLPSKTAKYEQFSPPDGGYITIGNTTYSVVVYSSDYYEEDANIYRGMDHYETMEAYTVVRSRTSYTKIDETETTVSEPDYLYCANLDTYQLQHIANEKLTLQPTPLVWTYFFKMNVTGLKYVVSTRGAITGMSESVMLSSGVISKHPVTVFYEGLTNDNDQTATYTFRSFGPVADKEHVISLEFLKIDGTIERFDITSTSEQVNGMLHGGEIVIPSADRDIDITPAGDGGFGGDVGDWDDTEVVLPPISPG